MKAVTWMVSGMKIRLSCGEICSKGIVWIAFSHKIKLCSFHQAFPCWGWEVWNPPTRLQSLLTYLLYWGTHYLSTKSLLFQRIKIDNSQKRCKCSKQPIKRRLSLLTMEEIQQGDIFSLAEIKIDKNFLEGSLATYIYM